MRFPAIHRRTVLVTKHPFWGRGIEAKSQLLRQHTRQGEDKQGSKQRIAGLTDRRPLKRHQRRDLRKSCRLNQAHRKRACRKVKAALNAENVPRIPSKTPQTARASQPRQRRCGCAMAYRVNPPVPSRKSTSVRTHNRQSQACELFVVTRHCFRLDEGSGFVRGCMDSLSSRSACRSLHSKIPCTVKLLAQ